MRGADTLMGPECQILHLRSDLLTRNKNNSRRSVDQRVSNLLISNNYEPNYFPSVLWFSFYFNMGIVSFAKCVICFKITVKISSLKGVSSFNVVLLLVSCCTKTSL